MLDSILTLAVIVLPGWLSITANRLYRPADAENHKSTVMEWGMVFFHATVVNVLGVIVVAIVLTSRPDVRNIGLDRILTEGPIAFVKSSPSDGFIVYGLYLLWLVIGSTISGTANLPSGIIYTIGWLAHAVRLAPDRLQEDPVWYSAFTIDRRASGKSNVQLRVRMKNGDIYVGNLSSYPILPDSEDAKDLRLGDSIYYPAGDVDSAEELSFRENGGGGVLLNTSNVSSIEYMYHDNYETSDRE